MSLNPLSRRAFLALAGAAAGSATLAGRSAFASPLSPWSQGAKSAGKKPGTVPVGIELYTVRDALKADLMGTVRGVAKMGYEVVEFYSPYYDWTPQQASDVKKLLDDLGVKALSTHNSATVFTPEGIQKAIDLNQAIGSKCIVMASAVRLLGPLHALLSVSIGAAVYVIVLVVTGAITYANGRVELRM